MLIRDMLADFNQNKPFSVEGKFEALFEAADLFSPEVRRSLMFIHPEKPSGFWSMPTSFTLSDLLLGVISPSVAFASPGIRSTLTGPLTLLTPDQLLLAALLRKDGVTAENLTAQGSFDSLLKAMILRKFSTLTSGAESLSRPNYLPDSVLIEELLVKIVYGFTEDTARYLKDYLKTPASPFDHVTTESSLESVAPNSLLVTETGSSSINKYSTLLDEQLLKKYFEKVDISKDERVRIIEHRHLLGSQVVSTPGESHSFKLTAETSALTTAGLFLHFYSKFYDDLVRKTDERDDIDDLSHDDVFAEIHKDAFQQAVKTCSALS